MKTKMFKSALSLLLVMLLCVSIITPAITAAESNVAAAAADGDVLEKHAANPKIAKADLQGIFGDSTSIVNTAYYGFAPVPEADTELDTATITYVTGSSDIAAGDWLALKTTAYTGNLLNRKPDWTDASKRSQLSFSVRTYYTADFSVSGSADGALYLNGEEVSGSVNLFTDETYTVTAADVEGFTREVTGVTLGEAFTPESDLTVTAAYLADASAEISLTVGEGGTAKIIVDGAEATDIIPAGKLFTIEATPNTNRGYKTDSIIVTRNGEEIESGDGVYGPVADGESYTVTVTFKYDPPRVEKEVAANDAKVTRTDLSNYLGSYSYYGIAPASDPDNITQLVAILSPNYNVQAGEYIIYATNDNTGGILGSPIWTNAKLMILTVTVYYNGTFTVTGNDEGEVYLNGEAVSGSFKLYPDTEYTVTAKAIDEYLYTIEGAEDGVAFTPDGDVNVTVNYFKEAYATFTVNADDGGSVIVRSDGDVVTERVSAGSTFTVEAVPNTNRGYELGSVVVTKDSEEIEAVDGAYGPVADGDSYEISVSFTFNPPRVEKEVAASGARVTRTDLSNYLGSYSYYGIAPASDPDNITQLVAILSPNYNVQAGEYYIYATNDNTGGLLGSPIWTNAKLMILTVTVYYNGTFTVTGNDEGEVYLNGEAVNGTVKLYPDTEYTVTAKDVDEYFYTIEGAEDGVAFTPSSDINVTVEYMKLAYATFSVNASDGGTAAVYSNGVAMTDRISEGATFTVQANPNTDRGYKVDTITVTKNGAEVEAVEGVYGPVADKEEYLITVTFKFEPDEVNYDLHADSGMTSTIISGLFGDSALDLLTKSYGFASVDTPDEITNASILGDDVEAGEYYIYRTNISLSSPDWANAKILKLNLRTYYNGSFTVTAPDSMPEQGEIYLNGESVTGTKRLYTDETYTVTKKDIEEYICTLYGVEDGEEFAPTANLDVIAVYMKEAYATVTVTANEGGTVKLLSGDTEVFDRIPEGDSFTVRATANANNDYYVDSIVVTKDGEEIEAVDGVYGPVADDEEYEVTVTFAKASLALEDCEVSLLNISNQDYDALAQEIIASAALDPAAFADGAQIDVEYVAFSVLGADIYMPLDYTASTMLAHNFGTSENGGIVKGGNTEKVRVTYTLPAYGIELSASATVTVRDDRIATRIAGNNVTITYGDDLKAAVMDAITVYDAVDNTPIEFTEEDITITPASLNANLLSAIIPQEVNVLYGGNKFYAISEASVNVYVRRAQSSLDTKSETITYGETPAAEVITTPENLDYIKVIGGIDGEAQGFVSIDIPDSVKNRMQIKLGDVVLLDIYDILSRYVGSEGTTLGGLKDIVTDIYNSITENELVQQAIELSGFNLEILDTIMDFIEQLPDFQSNLKIRLGQVPTNTGAYLMFAVSTDTNYTTSADLSYIAILPQTENEDGAFELRFKAEMQGDGNIRFLDYEEAADFVFGGDLYAGDTLTENENLHTYYVGTTFKGELISQEEPVREPGLYVETVYMQESNKWVTPIIRTYTINCIETELKMDDLTVPYDGEAHALEAYLEDAEIEADNITYTYIGSGYIGKEAPVNAGEYTVYAFYAGDAEHMSASAIAKLTVEKLDATITVSCEEEVTYGDINIFNALNVANIEYTVSGTINDDSLGLIFPTLPGEGILTVGEYTASVLFIQTNPNYNVTIEDATLTIVPREVTITVSDADKIYGDEDPELTYQIDNLAFFDKAEVTVTRKPGEDIGSYEITAEVAEDPNYNFIVDSGTLTIHNREIIVTVLDAQKVYGDDDPEYTCLITDADGTPYEDENLTVTYIREEGEDVGTYEITAKISDRKNYTPVYVPGTLTIESVAQYILGDFDGDGEVTAIDVTWIQRYLAYMDLLDSIPYNYAAADVDGDGDITSVDATLIQRYLAGMDEPYGVGTLVDA